MKDCTKCEYHKTMGSRTKGVKIPHGTGKCTRPEGHCDPNIASGRIGQGPVIRHPENIPPEPEFQEPEWPAIFHILGHSGHQIPIRIYGR